MGSRSQAAVAELRDAVLACRASDEWWIEDRQAFDLFRYSISRWVDDLGRSLNRSAAAIEKADTHSGEPDEEMSLQLEEALTQIRSARETSLSPSQRSFSACRRSRLKSPASSSSRATPP